MRTAEIAGALALILLAAVAAVDTFKTSGWEASGPASGWYPFWSAITLGAAGLWVLAGAVTSGPRGAFLSAEEGPAPFAKAALPMVAVAAAIPWLGFYLTSGIYMGALARWQGRYRWLAVAALGIGVPLAIYLCFEQGFRVPLPKSILYGQGILLF